jgi:pyochelin synthetase
MNAGELLDELESAGVQVWREGPDLRFRAPQGVMTGERLARLRDGKAALLARLTDARTEPFPLTDIQSAYLFGRNPAFAYGGVSCHLYQEFDYPADLDADRLARAWDAVVRRHDALRTVIRPDGTQQVVPAAPDTGIVVTDLRGSAAARMPKTIAAVRDELSHKVHPVDERPMYELRLTLADDRAVLHVSVDFMALDWLSIELALSEMDSVYRHPEGGALPPLDTTFRDYVVRERQLRDTDRHAADRAYWLDRIDDLPGAPALPLRDDHDPATVPARFRRRSARVPDRVWRALKERATAHGITPANAVLAAFAETIGRWSGTDRFCLGLPVLNRMPLHPLVDQLLGDFTALTVLAVEPAGHTTFADRARALGERVFDDLDHRLFSGVEVLQELARRRGRTAAAVLPVVFTGSIGVPGRASRPSYGISQTPQVWIDCQVGDQHGDLDMNWDVRDGIFPDGLVDEMFAAFVDLLHRLAGPDAPWTAAAPQPLPGDQRARRAAVNATDAAIPAGLLHEPLVAYARANPDRIAVVDATGTMTYGEWLGRATGVAAALRAAGCRPGDLVGILVDKSRDQVAGVLGALLAGGVYVPVDLGQPALRRDGILTAAGIGFAVVAGAVTLPGGIRVVDVTAVDPLSEAGIPVEPAGLAYVIHTSGSTGVPKGVMISHRAAANTVHDVNQRFGVTGDDRVFGLAALSFDLSVYDLFGPTALGATLVLPDPARRGDPSYWAAMVAEHRITLWNSVPAQMQMLTHYLDVEPADVSSLRLALLSGDWIPLSLPGHAARHLPGAELISLGGATEAAIWSNYHRIRTVPPQWRSIPYGVPLANQRFHVLDNALRDRPDLVTGELFIAGAGLADGYLGDPDRTAERFIVHPATGERLYRTGDLGRYLPNGEIEFLGRADQQVKIRGHRIELGEIEVVLGAHPAVNTAVVLAAGSGVLDRTLVAFVILGEPAEPAELLAWTADRLPAHMVPAWVQPVETLPLTANGKVDRKRLLAAAPVPGAAPEGPAEPPRPGLEQRIADLWGEVLGSRPAGRELGFFDAGGNSLLAARLVGLVREQFPGEPFDVLLRALLDTPTIAGLAARLSAGPMSAGPMSAGPLSAGPAAADTVAAPGSLVALGGSGHGRVRLLVGETLWTLAAGLADSEPVSGPVFGPVFGLADAAAVRGAGFDDVEVIGHFPDALEVARTLNETEAAVRLTVLSGPLPDDPEPYAGDITLVRPSADEIRAWQEICLGEITIAGDLPGSR